MGVGICTSLTQSLPSEGGIGVGGCKAMLLSPDSVDWALPESFQLTLAVCVTWSAKLRSGFSYPWICFVKVRKHPLCNVLI